MGQYSGVTFIARAEFQCIRCRQPIHKGQGYSMRMETYKDPSGTHRDAIRWHANARDCSNPSRLCRHSEEGI